METDQPLQPMRELPYEPPVLGENYWVVDNVLPDPMAVRQRVMMSQDWEFGSPYTSQVWPGMRHRPCLNAKELDLVEKIVRRETGSRRLWVQRTEGVGHLNHNCVQVVGAGEGYVKPHTDSRQYCVYAGLIYLLPDAPPECGTGFYRQRMPDGRLGGNIAQPPHDNLVEALGTRFVAPDSFVEDVRVDNVFNRFIFYKANLIHSASQYCGQANREKRMTNVFFWQAE